MGSSGLPDVLSDSDVASLQNIVNGIIAGSMPGGAEAARRAECLERVLSYADRIGVRREKAKDRIDELHRTTEATYEQACDDVYSLLVKTHVHYLIWNTAESVSQLVESLKAAIALAFEAFAPALEPLFEAMRQCAAELELAQQEQIKPRVCPRCAQEHGTRPCRSRMIQSRRGR